MTEQISHPDFPQASMKVQVTVAVTEDCGYLNRKSWTTVNHEISSTMSPIQAFAKLEALVASSVKEAATQFDGAAKVAEINRADQVKQLTTEEC